MSIAEARSPSQDPQTTSFVLTLGLTLTDAWANRLCSEPCEWAVLTMQIIVHRWVLTCGTLLEVLGALWAHIPTDLGQTARNFFSERHRPSPWMCCTCFRKSTPHFWPEPRKNSALDRRWQERRRARRTFPAVGMHRLKWKNGGTSGGFGFAKSMKPPAGVQQCYQRHGNLCSKSHSNHSSSTIDSVHEVWWQLLRLFTRPWCTPPLTPAPCTCWWRKQTTLQSGSPAPITKKKKLEA